MQRSTAYILRAALVLTMVVIACGSALAQRRRAFLSGGDVSEIPQVEAAGGHYSYRDKVMDPFVLMRQAGWNFVRFRIWNDPRGGLCNKDYALKLAQRAKAQGLKISLDFHYSDWWADPGKQYAPAAWKNLSFDQAKDALYDYTKDVVSAMVAQGTPPYMVQIGNEITSGMAWPFAKLKGNDPEPWAHLAALISAGAQAVHDAAGRNKILTMIHLDRGGDNKGATWWFDHLAEFNVKFDAIGLSYYPFWHGHLDAMQANVNDLAARYGKDIYIVETAYPWSTASAEHQQGAVFDGKRGLEPGYEATPEGQAAIVKKIRQIVDAIPHHRGRGLLYWAPTWIYATGQKTPYANLATFDYAGNALPAVNALASHR